MNPENDFYYGAGMIVATFALLFVWAVCVFGFDSNINIGTFSGTFIVGTYYIFKAISNGRRTP